MRLLERLGLRRAPEKAGFPAKIEQKTALSLDVLARMMGEWGKSNAGVAVNETTALQVSTVAACVMLIANDVATLPLHVRRHREGGSKLAATAPEFDLLFRQPNEWQTAFEFRQMMTAQAVLRGNAYAYKVFNGAGRVAELWPLMASECQPNRQRGVISYDVTAFDGSLRGKFPRERIMHLRGFTWDGWRGVDRVDSARDTIGLASAAAGTQAKSFANGNRMPGYWTTDEYLRDEQLNRLVDQLITATTGDNQYKSPILDAGLKYQSSGQNFDEAQLVETRKHQIVEVCAAFNVVPAVLGIDDKTQAFASVEAMMRWHLQHTLRPWLTMWEQAIDRDVLDTARGPLFAKFDTSEMEKASTKERAESYTALLENLVMFPNEARELEGLPRIDGLDEEWREIVKGRAGLMKAPEGGSDDQET